MGTSQGGAVGQSFGRQGHLLVERSGSLDLPNRRKAAVVLDTRVQRRHRVRNVAQAVLLLGGMVGVLVGLAWLLFGPSGLLPAFILAAVLLALRPRLTPRRILGMYRARPIPPAAAPELHRYVQVLADRARLPTVPTLYYVPSRQANAFAVGRPDDAALAVTDGLLRRLPSRELAGVLAHEVSHIRADDLWIMSLSDTFGRLTHALSYAGLFTLLISAPLTAARGTLLPLLLALVLAAVPTVVTLLQLALSRSREYDADIAAATLTGDPGGLASALRHLERQEGRIWERVLVPHRRAPDPLLLRTHPATEERVRRLLELVPSDERRRLGNDRPVPPAGYPQVQSPARLRFPGIRW